MDLMFDLWTLPLVIPFAIVTIVVLALIVVVMWEDVIHDTTGR